MKIMFCVLCLSYGGAEKNLCIVADALADKGHEVLICNFNTLPTIQKFRNDIRVIDMPKYTAKVVKRFQQIKFMTALCKKEKPDLLISFLFLPNMLTPIVGKITHIPTIISERGDPSRRSGKLQNLYNLATGAVFQTEGARDYYSEKLQKNSVVIPNPVIVKENMPQVDYENAKKSIVFSARFSIEQKRQDIMIEAFCEVHKMHPDYTLDFYGDGPDEEKMKQFAEEKGLKDCVIFHGLSKNMLSDMSGSEIFALSSDYEGIPNALIEAMSLGLPSVSTDCSPGGARLLIEDGKNGLIVPCGDKNALAEAINKFIENRDFAISCGKNAKGIIEKFELGKMMNLWEAYCIKIVKGGKDGDEH